MERMKMVKQGALVTLLCLIMVVAGYTYAKLTVSRDIQSGASIVTDVYLSVYQTGGAVLTQVDWGTILPGEVKTFLMFVQNDAALPMAITLSTRDWSPTGIEVSLNFSYVQGSGWVNYPTLEVGRKAGLIMSLECMGEAIAGNFSFVIVVTGETL